MVCPMQKKKPPNAVNRYPSAPVLQVHVHCLNPKSITQNQPDTETPSSCLNFELQKYWWKVMLCFYGLTPFGGCMDRLMRSLENGQMALPQRSFLVFWFTSVADGKCLSVCPDFLSDGNGWNGVRKSEMLQGMLHNLIIIGSKAQNSIHSEIFWHFRREHLLLTAFDLTIWGHVWWAGGCSMDRVPLK